MWINVPFVFVTKNSLHSCEHMYLDWYTPQCLNTVNKTNYIQKVASWSKNQTGRHDLNLYYLQIVIFLYISFHNTESPTFRRRHVKSLVMGFPAEPVFTTGVCSSVLYWPAFTSYHCPSHVRPLACLRSFSVSA